MTIICLGASLLLYLLVGFFYSRGKAVDSYTEAKSEWHSEGRIRSQYRVKLLSRMIWWWYYWLTEDLLGTPVRQRQGQVERLKARNAALKTQMTSGLVDHQSARILADAFNENERLIHELEIK